MFYYNIKQKRNWEIKGMKKKKFSTKYNFCQKNNTKLPQI